MENAVILFPGKICINDIKDSKYNIIETYNVLPKNYPVFDFLVHTIIVFDNYYIDKKNILTIICQAIEHGYNIVSFFKLSVLEKETIKNLGSIYNVRTDLYDIDNTVQDTIFKINVPVFFVSGMGDYCDQIKTHLLLSEALKDYGFDPLNITNSKVGKLCGLYDINDVLDEKFEIVVGKSSSLIQKINNWIYKEVEKTQKKAVIISDVKGIFPYDESRTNDFGFYNNVLKYACPYDYVIYNIYSKEYSKEELYKIHTRVVNATNTNSVKIGMAQTITAITLPGLYTNDGYLNLIDKEYDGLLYDMNENFDIIDIYSSKEMHKYVGSLIV